MTVPLGPAIVDRIGTKIVRVRAAVGWPGLPCEGLVDLEYGQYGPRPVFNTPLGPTNPDHSGVDIGAWYGTPLGSVAPGEVVFAGYDGARAQVVVVRHDDGDGAIYVHMDGWMPPVGKRVARGEVIGYVGSTGMSTGPHVHFMRVKRVPVPYPSEYFWFDRTDVVDPFGEEAGWVEALTVPDPEQPVDYVIGAWPRRGQAAILVTMRDAHVENILEEAIRVGVTLTVFFIIQNGQWQGYYVGAPAPVNAQFPTIIPAYTPLFVRAA